MRPQPKKIVSASARTSSCAGRTSSAVAKGDPEFGAAAIAEVAPSEKTREVAL